MVQTDRICNVTNRSHTTVIYSIPEDNIRREFAPGEAKKIKYGELEKLSYKPGGQRLMQDYFLIDHEGAIEDLNIIAEPEYYLNSEGVIDLLKNGSQDLFLDCLENAPEGVIDLIKSLAVSLPVTDTQKLEAIQKYTGFNAAAAIRHNKEEQMAEENPEIDTPQRVRRAEPKYKIVNN